MERSLVMIEKILDIFDELPGPHQEVVEKVMSSPELTVPGAEIIEKILKARIAEEYDKDGTRDDSLIHKLHKAHLALCGF